MKKIIALLVLVIAVIYLWPEPEPEPVIHTAAPETLRDTTGGPVIGFRDLEDTAAWLGIPFATAPVGELRWSAPRPAAAWAEARETLDFSDPCIQLWGMLSGVPDGEAGQVVGSEDCLYLNIWAPADRSSAETGGLPVMFWIHGGGNSIGTANTYPANRLAGGENVVVVTINYRLGVLGWMSHPALREGRDLLDGSGNYGNLDMIAALAWVRDNIANFGGDPGNVTIFGESAGGRNVYSLMASPLAGGLFHRAISQSGSTATAPLWRAENFVDDEQPGHPLSSREWLLLQIQQSGQASDRDGARKVLGHMSELDLLSFMYSRTPEQMLQGLAGIGFGMYMAPQVMRDGAVIPSETLYELFHDPARYNAVPLITGTNRDEMKVFLAQNPDLVERRFGFLPRIKNLAVYNSISAYLSDNWKALAVDGAAEIISANAGQPVFSYRWDWDEGGRNWLVDYSTLLGAGHGLELAYVFNDFDGAILVPGLYTEENTPGRDQLARQMRSYWSEFARSGDPGRGSSGDLPRWQAWGKGGDNLMILDTEAGGGLRMANEPMTIAMLKDRVAGGQFPDLKTRCTLFAQLFLHANDGDDVWDQQEFIELGCGEYDPWALEPGG